MGCWTVGSGKTEMKTHVSGDLPHPRPGGRSGPPTTLNTRPGELSAGNTRRNRDLEKQLRIAVARAIEETFGRD